MLHIAGAGPGGGWGGGGRTPMGIKGRLFQVLNNS